MIKSAKITNRLGETFEFSPTNRLLEGIDLSGLAAVVNFSASNNNGSIYKNTSLENRAGEISFTIRKNGNPIWLEEQRERMFRILNPTHNRMRLDFTTIGGKELYINIELTSTPFLPIDSGNNNPAFQRALIQFICTDPYIYEATQSKVEIAQWTSNMEFPLEIFEGIELGYREPSLIKNVYNSGNESIGMLIRFHAKSQVLNPSLVNVRSYETLKLDFTMQADDVIEVNTTKGRRTIKLIRNNVTSNIFDALSDEGEDFLQLHPGDNLFRYAADDGSDYLNVTAYYTPVRVGI